MRLDCGKRLDLWTRDNGEQRLCIGWYENREPLTFEIGLESTTEMPVVLQYLHAAERSVV